MQISIQINTRKGNHQKTLKNQIFSEENLKKFKFQFRQKMIFHTKSFFYVAHLYEKKLGQHLNRIYFIVKIIITCFLGIKPLFLDDPFFV